MERADNYGTQRKPTRLPRATCAEANNNGTRRGKGRTKMKRRMRHKKRKNVKRTGGEEEEKRKWRTRKPRKARNKWTK
jgi:hypothetical protein